MRRWTRTAAAGGLEYTVEKVESKRQLRNDFFLRTEPLPAFLGTHRLRIKALIMYQSQQYCERHSIRCRRGGYIEIEKGDKLVKENRSR
jgi:hypothetical protein